MSRKHVGRVALIDPINEVAYSKSVRRNSAGYQEDAQLQRVMADRGVQETHEFATRRYHGSRIAVMPR